MHREFISFKDVFQFDHESGRISLGSNRYVMLDAAALGNMRREFIDNLGWEVARGILERVGYYCGRQDAHQLAKRHNWLSDEDWLRAGLRLHCLEGIVRSALENLEINRRGGKLHVKGEWVNSFEAEQHLQQYGIGSRSVCWILEGYASGYASECFGEEAVCLETQCRGKGDAACKFEILPEAQWGDSGRALREMLSTARFTERFDRCLRIISDMGCELEQTSLDAIITTDAGGFITSCSQGASQILGLPPSEAIGMNISSFYAGGSSEVNSMLERLKDQRRFQNYMTELVDSAGRKTPISLSASAITNRAGEITGMIGVAHDLSEIRHLEDELSKKNRFMANILRDSADAIITMDPDDIITSWNKGAESIFGYVAGEIIGKPISILLTPELRESRELEMIARKFRAQGAVRNHQTERITKDGRRIQVIFTRTAIHDESGKVIGSSSVLKDVSSFRSLERQLADAEHLATLGELSAGLAHEIKNPLAGIKGAIEVILDSLHKKAAHREILGDVIHEVNRIDKIVRDLLNYAKPKQGSHSSIELPSLVQRMVAIARATSKHNHLPINVKQWTAIPSFTGDETQLEQVLLNLLLNAQNAMPAGGHIEVALSYDSAAAAVKMVVSDDGPGIPEELRKKIFQPFFTTRTDGTGLGLATCLKNLQYHGGTIEVQSELGRGTKFTATIPMLCHI
jgi:PAS domain S-box-containing protein